MESGGGWVGEKGGVGEKVKVLFTAVRNFLLKNRNFFTF